METILVVMLLILAAILYVLSRQTMSIHSQQNNTVVILTPVNMNKIVTASEDEFENFVEEVLDAYLQSDYVPVTSNQLQEIIQMRRQWLDGQIDLSTRIIPVKEKLLVKDLMRAEEFLVEIQKDRSTRKRLKGYKGEIQELISLLRDSYQNNPIAFCRQDIRTPEEVERTGGTEVTGLQKLDDILFSRLTKKPFIEEANNVVSKMARDMHDLSRHILKKLSSERDLARMNKFIEDNEGKLNVFL